jgi:hypothetical protein
MVKRYVEEVGTERVRELYLEAYAGDVRLKSGKRGGVGEADIKAWGFAGGPILSRRPWSRSSKCYI